MHLDFGFVSSSHALQGSGPWRTRPTWRTRRYRRAKRRRAESIRSSTSFSSLRPAVPDAAIGGLIAAGSLRRGFKQALAFRERIDGLQALLKALQDLARPADVTAFLDAEQEALWLGA